MAEENAAVGAMDAVDQLGQKKQSETGANHKSKSSSSISKPKIWGSFQRTDFRAVEGTGAQISREGRDLKTEARGEVQVSEQLHQRYHQFLKDHLVGLQRIYKTNRSLYDQMNRSQTHSYETKLLQMVCDRDEYGEFKVDTEGNLLFSEERINSILANPEGWELTTMLLEQQTSYQLFALGVNAAIDPRGNRNLLLNNENIDLGIDSGVLREFYHRYLADYLEEDLPSAGGRQPGLLNRIHTPRWRALTGILIGSGLGGIIGGLPGAAVVPGLTALREVLKRGVGMDLHRCAEVLDSIKGNNNNRDTLETKYLRELYQIDINDFTTQNGAVELVNRSAQTTFNSQEARTQILGNIYSRLLFYESIGVPAEQLDALPEQFLYRYLEGDSEQTATHMQRDILEEFRPNQGGIQPNDIAGNLKRFRKARVKVLTGRIEAIIQRETNKLNYQGSLTDLQTMINARENSTMVTAAKKEAQRRKDELTRQKEQLPKLESHETYTNKRQQLDEMLESASTRAEYPITPNQGETFAQAITRQINQINTQLRVANFPQGQVGGLEDQLDNLNQTFNVNLLQQINGFMQGLQNIQLPRGTKLPEGFIDQAVQLITNQLTAANRAQVERLTQQIEHLKQQREELTQLGKQYQTAQTELQQAERSIIEAAPKNLVTLIGAYDMIINQLQNVPGTIDLATLQNASIDQLIIAVSSPNSPYLPLIPANILQNPSELRQYLLQAKTEAAAQAVEAYDVSPAQQLADYQAFLVANPNGQLNLDTLLTMSNAQIDQILRNPQNPYQALLGQRTAREVRESLQSEARKRLRIRSRILIEAQVDDIDAQITVQDRIIDQNFTEQIQILSKTKKMAQRQGEIFYSVNDIFARPTEILSSTVIGNQDQTYTVSERGANIPRGYVELINIFFGYQREVDKRDADFAEIMRILPPDRLATLLNQHCHLNLEQNPITINNVLDSLRNRIHRVQRGQPRLSRINLQQGFAAIINQLVAQARALS